jgi:hypothetical protein
VYELVFNVKECRATLIIKLKPKEINTNEKNKLLFKLFLENNRFFNVQDVPIIETNIELHICRTRNEYIVRYINERRSGFISEFLSIRIYLEEIE